MSNQLTPIQEAIEKVTELHNNEEITGFTKRAYAICLDVLTELLPKEQQVIEENENLLDEITASIGNEYRLPFWIETKLNERRLSQH